jgi:ribosomal-protein-alanine N-acetyltransferase
MQAADIEAVVDIEKLCFSTFWPVNAYINEMANRCAWYAVAKMGDRVVGYGGMWVIMDEAHITTLAVLPELRRQGLGLRLMDAMLREAIRRGARRSTLEVRRSNLAAITLYERLGYRGAAVRKAYYSDTREDALVMWAEGLHTEAYSLKLKEMLGEE